MVRLSVSATQEQQQQQQHKHAHNNNNNNVNNNNNNYSNSNINLTLNQQQQHQQQQQQHLSNNVASTSSSTSSLNSNTSVSSYEHPATAGGIVMVVPQQAPLQQQQQQHQQQQLPPQQQQQQQQQHQQQQQPYVPHVAHHHAHHHPAAAAAMHQQHSPSDGSASSLPASPPLLQQTPTPPQGAQIVPPVCAVHHPQQHQQQLAIVAMHHQAAAAHLAATAGAMGPPPHMHHAHAHVPPPTHGLASPPVGSAAAQQQSQQQQAQHSQQHQHAHENGHVHVPGPGVSPSGSTGSSGGGSVGGGGGNGPVVAQAPPPGPVYIQYPGEFYPAAEYYLAPHPHDGICPQHPHHHQQLCAMPTDYGPTTVQMVSQNRPPPMPVPVQVPQGQVMQQYVNENGTLTHVVLSPQQYQQLHAGQGHIHAPFLTTNGTSHFYSPIPAGFQPGPGGGGPTHFHAMSGGHLQPQPPPPQQQQHQQQSAPSSSQGPTPPQQTMSHSPHSPSPPSNNSYHKDERSQRQHTKLQRKLEKQREFNPAMPTPAHSPSPRRNEINGHHNHLNATNNSSSSVITAATTVASINNNNGTSSSSSNSHNHHQSYNNHQQQQQQQQQYHQQHQLNNHHHGSNNNNNNARRLAAQRNGGLPAGAVAAVNSSTQPVSHMTGSVGGASSVGTSEDGEDTSSLAEEEEDYQATIVEQLSSIQKPEVTNITSRSAKIIWEAPALSNPLLLNVRDLRYNVLLSDRAKECKYKSLYKGESYDCIVQDLQPGQEYVVRLQVHYEKLQGSASDPTEFITPPCEPDMPLPPKLVSRTKNSLNLCWTNPLANGAAIQHYLLEYDEGTNAAAARAVRQLGAQQPELHFVEAVKTKGKRYILTKLQPSTAYSFRLAAVNEVGPSTYSPICTYSTAGNPPAAPKPPTCQAVSVSSLRLIWERRQQDAGGTYVLQMLDRDSGHGFLNMYNGPDCVYECCQLRRATAYQFRLRAENEAGASSWSSEVSYKTAPEPPGRPGKPYAKGKIHGTYFRARWEPPTDTGGAEIKLYFLEITSGAKYERVYTGPEPETTCDRLQPGTTYQLRASCEGPAGQSAYSEVAHITSEAIVPAAPPPPFYDNPPGPYAAVLRLEKPDYNGGAPVLEFEVQMRRPADDLGAAEHQTAATPTIIYRGRDAYCVVKDLKPGCAYETQVRAINRIGAGAWSSWFRFCAAAAPSLPPATPKVVVKSATHLALSWEEPADCNGAAIAEYQLQSAAAVPSPADATETAPDSAAFQTCYQGAQNSAELRNLLPYTLYYFRVNAANTAGVSKWSALASAKTPAAVPAAPQIKDYEFTANEVSLRWTQPECNGAPITAYIIEYAEHTLTTSEATLQHTVGALTPETAYKFRVQAVNAIGAGPYSAYAKMTTLPSPPTPPTLECTGVGHNFIKLKWGDGRNPDFTKYYVEMYQQRAKKFHEVYTGTSCMCKVNKLQERTAYTFRVYASTDRAGDGDYSADFVFSTTAALPSSIKAPRVAYEGNVCLVAGGAGAVSSAASGYIPETPTSYIHGIGNVSVGVPLTLEWQHSKNSFSDRIEYVLQYAIGKDGDFKRLYRGADTKFTIENLEPGIAYQFRVCPVRVTSAGEDLPGQYTSAFRYQVPHLPSIDDLDSRLRAAGGLLGAGAAATANVGGCSGANAAGACHGHSHGHSHHSHHAHHMHNHNHHMAHHTHHNSRSGGGGSVSTLHHRSVSASAVSSSSGSSNSSAGGTLLLGGNAIGFIPLSTALPGDLGANFACCDDPHHQHHYHHYQFHGGAVAGNTANGSDTDLAPASLLAAATASNLPATHAAAAAAHAHAQNGAIRRFVTKLTSVYTNRKRFTDQEKAVIFMVSFLFFTFLFATLVKMFMR